MSVASRAARKICSRARDSYESDFRLLLYSDQFLVLDKVEANEKVCVIGVRYSCGRYI